jgi:hypothetical protein
LYSRGLYSVMFFFWTKFNITSLTSVSKNMSDVILNPVKKKQRSKSLWNTNGRNCKIIYYLLLLWGTMSSGEPGGRMLRVVVW